MGKIHTSSSFPCLVPSTFLSEHRGRGGGGSPLVYMYVCPSYTFCFVYLLVGVNGT